MNAVAQPELLEIATRLAKLAGRGRPKALHKLAGGKNNRVFSIETDGAPLVLKSYFKDPRDPRDRLAAEWTFLQRAWQLGVRAIPEPLASDPQARAGLYSYVAGRKLEASEVAASHVDAAIDFVLAINRAPRDLSALALGSEACFSLAQHLITVEHRIARLQSLDPEAPQRDDAVRFVAKSLMPAWTGVKQRAAREAQALGLTMDKDIAAEDICASPSDFGFHNALVEGGQVTFLDFEYAGRDDPAKLISDFFCQPEIPVPVEHHARVIARIADGLALSPESRARCAILLDTYRIKWTCIILNEFLPVGAARRAYACADERAVRSAAQFVKAKAKLAEIQH